jgi:polar amino acid transport system substrate-binding protein
MIKQKLLRLSLVMGLVAASGTVPSAALAASLEKIKERGKLVVAVKDDLRPLAFRDAEGNLQGLEIEIARRLAKELLGNADAVVWEPVTNRERLEAVSEGEADIAIARVTVTPSRSRLVNFSRRYYLDGTGLVTKDPSVQQLGDVSGNKIAVLKRSSTIAVMRYSIPNVELVGVDSYQEGLAVLEAGEASAFAADRSILTGWVQEYPQYRQLPVRLSGETLSVAMPKGLQYTELREQVNEAIARWRKSGWLRQTAIEWGLPWGRQGDTGTRGREDAERVFIHRTDFIREWDSTHH